MDAGSDSPVRFGLFQLDKHTGELLRSGRRIRLQEQPFRVLCMLLDRPGELVTREELRQTLWPGGTFVDFEDGLNAAVKRLRSALGESSENPIFIETIPRRGYRFIAPLTIAAEPTAEVEKASAGDAPPVASSARRFRLPTAAVVLLLTVLAIVAIYAASNRGTRPTDLPRVTPITSFQGYEQHPAFSPDGSRIAFAWDGGDGQFDIYVKVLNAPTPVRLTTHPRADGRPAWSPDGQRLAFVRNLGAEGQDVLVIAAVGGPEERIAHFPIVTDLAWSRAGTEVAVAKRETRSGPAAIVLIRTATREVRQLTNPREPRGDEGFAFSPDGRMLAIAKRSPNANGIYVQRLDGGEPRQVASEPGGIWDLSWTPDGKHIVFSSGPGRAALWRVPAIGGARERLSWAGEEVRWFSIAPSGDRIAFSHITSDHNIWEFRLGTDGAAAAGASLVASTWFDGAPELSPDGRKLAFISDRSGTLEVWISDAAGRNAIALTSFAGARLGNPRWSPDGRRIAFDAYPSGLSDVFVVDADGGAPRLLVGDAPDDVLAAWSADGQSLYFASNRGAANDKSSDYDIWKMPAAGGGARRITSSGAFRAAESTDGRTLFVSNRGARGLWKMPVDGGPAEPIVENVHGGVLGGWHVMADGVYFLADDDRTIRFYAFGTRQQTPVLVLDRAPDIWGGAFTVSPDRRRVLASLLHHAGSDIKLLENFR
jgi:Tol biopolymer transport system component/DNA-binding winged helix-turn-helix (wHTH) protein